MKSEMLLYAFHDIHDDYIEAAAPKKKKRIWIGAVSTAACLLLTVGIFFGTVYTDFDLFLGMKQFFSYQDYTLEMTGISVGERAARYYNPYGDIDTEALSHFVGELYLEETYTVPYEIYKLEHEISRKWYRIKGKDTAQHLICSENGELSLWEFSCFFTDPTYVWMVPHLREQNFSAYTYNEVFRDIYGLENAVEIEKIIISPSTANNTDEGKAVQREIGKKTLTDEKSIETLYEIISSIRFYSDESYPKQENLPSYDFDTSNGRDTRYLTIVLSDGTKIDCLKYTATGGYFYEYSGIHSEPLSEEDVLLVNDILGIGTK